MQRVSILELRPALHPNRVNSGLIQQNRAEHHAERTEGYSHTPDPWACLWAWEKRGKDRGDNAVWEAEILVLRHQLGVLQQRMPGRVHLRWADRAVFIWLYRCCPRILDAITIARI
jgi:hypothetical protein